jgi:hypothetical protein
MNRDIINTEDYRHLITNLKDRIQAAQIKAALAVNTQLIELYWDIGKLIAEKQQVSGWGDSVIEQIAQDLTRELGGLKDFLDPISITSSNGIVFMLLMANLSNSLLDKFPGGITC